MKKLLLTIGLIFFCVSFLLPREQKAERITLTLDDCILKALENNLDISVEAFNPEISEVSIIASREAFMPRFNFGYFNLHQNRLGSWWVEGANVITNRNFYSVGLTQKIITGGEISLSFTNTTTDTTQNLIIVNPTYGSELRLDFSQPLLKNFGPKINRREIKLAQNNRDISVSQLKSQLIQTVYEVEQVYWNLVYAHENLNVQEYFLEQSKERLKRNREGAKIGTKSPLEVLSSETDVARWEESILSARLQVEEREDQLRKIMNLPTDVLGLSRSILPIDKPTVEKKEISFEQALKIALEERPELEVSRKRIENSDIDVSYYKNQLLPQLDLRASLWYPGQSGDVLIYENNDFIRGNVIGKIKGSKGDSLEDVFKLTYDNWQVRLDLTVPLSNFISRADLARANVEKEQKLLEREKQEKSIYYEILKIIKELKTNEKKIDSSARYKELMEKQFEAEEQRYQLGLVGSQWLLRYQSDLASAKVQEIRAIIDYKMSIAELEKVLGMNLKTKNIKFRNYDF